MANGGERRRVKIILVVWVIWAAAIILAYCSFLAPAAPMKHSRLVPRVPSINRLPAPPL